MPPIIEVEELVKRYKQTEQNAVDGVSFTVEEGAFFALLGPNGAGKTTTVSILTTVLSPTSGRVMVAGSDVATQAARVRREVGIIFQEPSLDENLSGEENIRFHAFLYNLYPFRPSYALMSRAYKNQVDELASVLGLEKEIRNPIKTYSGGMKRKLEILRSLMHHPRILFLDEPTAGLDAEARRSLWDYLGEVRAREGTTTFLTTHYLEEAEDAASVCIIHHGGVLALGTPDEIKAELAENYLLLDTDNRPALLGELAAMNVPHTAGDRIRVERRDVPGTVHAFLKRIETPLTQVRTHAPSLEDAYLKVISRTVETDGH